VLGNAVAALSCCIGAVLVALKTSGSDTRQIQPMTIIERIWLAGSWYDAPEDC
jgi:hypothetical protein